MSPREIALREKLDEANETIQQMRDERRDELLPVAFVHYTGLTLSKTETTLVEGLKDGRLCRFPYLIARMAAVTGHEIPSMSCLQVAICRLRKKLAKLAVVIDNEYGAGFSMPAASVAILAGLRVSLSMSWPEPRVRRLVKR